MCVCVCVYVYVRKLWSVKMKVSTTPNLFNLNWSGARAHTSLSGKKDVVVLPLPNDLTRILFRTRLITRGLTWLHALALAPHPRDPILYTWHQSLILATIAWSASNFKHVKIKGMFVWLRLARGGDEGGFLLICNAIRVLLQL